MLSSALLALYTLALSSDTSTLIYDDPLPLNDPLPNLRCFQQPLAMLLCIQT